MKRYLWINLFFMCILGMSCWVEALDETSTPPVYMPPQVYPQVYMPPQVYPQAYMPPQGYPQANMQQKKKKEKAFSSGFSYIINNSPLTQTIPGVGSATFEIGTQISASLDVIHRTSSGLVEYMSYTMPITPGEYPNIAGETVKSKVSMFEAGLYNGTFKLGFNMPLWTLEMTDAYGNPLGSLNLASDMGYYAGIVIGKPSMHIEVGYQTLKGSITDDYSGLTLQFEISGPVGKIGIAF